MRYELRHVEVVLARISLEMVTRRVSEDEVAIQFFLAILCRPSGLNATGYHDYLTSKLAHSLRQPSRQYVWWIGFTEDRKGREDFHSLGCQLGFRVENCSWTRQSSGFVDRTEFWRIRLPES